MLLDTSTLPVGGAALLAGAAYAAVMMFGLGPLVAERTASKEGWPGLCERHLVEQVSMSRPETQTPLPKLDCEGFMNAFTGGHSEGNSQLCGLFGTLQSYSVVGQIEAQNRKLQKTYQRQIENVARNAETMCSCALAVVQSEDQMSWGIYAGSLRLFQPAEVKNRNANLTAALSSDLCRREVR